MKCQKVHEMPNRFVINPEAYTKVVVAKGLPDIPQREVFNAHNDRVAKNLKNAGRLTRFKALFLTPPLLVSDLGFVEYGKQGSKGYNAGLRVCFEYLGEKFQTHFITLAQKGEFNIECLERAIAQILKTIKSI